MISLLVFNLPKNSIPFLGDYKGGLPSPIKKNRISIQKLLKKTGVFLEKSLYRIKKTFLLVTNYLKDTLKIDKSRIDESCKVVYRKNSTDSARSNESSLDHYSSLSSLSSLESDSFLSAIQFKFDQPLEKKERIVSNQLRENDRLKIENRFSELEKKAIRQPEEHSELEKISELIQLRKEVHELEKRYYSSEGEKQGAKLSWPMAEKKALLLKKRSEYEQAYSNIKDNASLVSSESKVSEKNPIKLDRAMPGPIYQEGNFSSPGVSDYDHLDHFRTNSPLLSKTQADYKSLNSVPLSPNQKNRAEDEKKSPIYENINNQSLFFKSIATEKLLPRPSNSRKISQEKIMDSFDKPHNFFSNGSSLQKLHHDRSINLSSRSLTTY